MTRERIIILGTKPNPNLLRGDVIYCANAAIGLYPQYIKNFSWSVAVLSASILKNTKNKSLRKEKREIVLNSYADKYVVSACNTLENLGEVERVLKSINKSASFEYFSRKERRDLIRSVTKLKEPYLTKSVFHLSFYAKLLLIKEFLKAGVRCLKGDIEWPGYCRISTGLFSLAYAIYEHGSDCDYVLSGIGIGHRGIYKMNGVEFQKKCVLMPHLEADLKALRKLSECYQVSTSDYQLSQSAGIDFLKV
jgi:hypothetical protein